VSQRYQTGHLRRARRKSGPHVWEFLWRETDERGRRVHRTAIVGTVEQYPTEELAWTAANGLRVYLNGSRNHYSAKSIPIRDLIDHYVHTDLSADTGWHSHATRTIYLYFLDRWIRPDWGEIALHSVRTMAVEHWLRGLRRADGGPLQMQRRGRSATSSVCSSIMQSAASGLNRAGIPLRSFGRVRDVRKYPWFSNQKRFGPSFRSCNLVFA
jgi:hypothetical protein